MIACVPDKYHCAHCPIRRQAMKRPHSIFARIHRWHCTLWPGWKAYTRALRGSGPRPVPAH